MLNMVFVNIRAIFVLILLVSAINNVVFSETNSQSSSLNVETKVGINSDMVKDEEIRKVLNIESSSNVSYDRVDGAGKCPPDGCGCTDEGGTDCDCGVVNGHCYCKLCPILSSLEIEPGATSPDEDSDTDSLSDELESIAQVFEDNPIFNNITNTDDVISLYQEGDINCELYSEKSNISIVCEISHETKQNIRADDRLDLLCLV